MNTIEQSEQIRKRMKAISEKINNSLDQYSSPRNSVGIKYENDPTDRCPHCGSGLKTRSGHKDGKQRWACVICHRKYFEKEE